VRDAAAGAPFLVSRGAVVRAHYSRWMVGLYWACIWLAGLSVVAMTLIIPWGVYARYVLGTGSEWPEPLAVLLMIVFTFFGAAACYRANSHIAVALFKDMLPPKPRAWLGIAVDLLLALISLFMVIWGFQLVGITWQQSIAEFPWLPVGASYLPLPLGSIVSLLFIIERLWCGPAKDLVEATEGPAAGGAEAN
jgi:TRAP-type C4-dicarboxylate transport system permease small subunit